MTTKPSTFRSSYWDRALLRFNRPFWESPSTELYATREIQVIETYLTPLAHGGLLKLDLWNEVQNTRIIQRLALRGFRTTAIDISPMIVKKAKSILNPACASTKVLVADAQNLPFRDNSFSTLYTMGTIEHLESPETAIKECFRVLKPGGRAIIGVPYCFDPFGFVLCSYFLQFLGLYPYGKERFFSKRRLKAMAEHAGFSIISAEGLLFLPWFLRWMDLITWIKWPSFNRWTRPIIMLFAWLNDRFQVLPKKFGYLIFVVVEKPKTA